MPILHTDQAPARRRCLEILAGPPSAAERQELRDILRDVEIAHTVLAPAGVDSNLDDVLRAGDYEAARKFVTYAIRPLGRPLPLRVALVAAFLCAASVGLGTLTTVRAGVAVGVIGLIALGLSLPFGGLLGRSFWDMVFDGRTRRTFRRGQTLEVMSLERPGAVTLCERMFAEAEAGLGDTGMAGQFFGRAVEKAARRAVDGGHVPFLRCLYSRTRQLITAGRVPWLAGGGLGEVLRTAVDAPAEAGLSPVFAWHLLARLQQLAPDAALRWAGRLRTASQFRIKHLDSGRAPGRERYVEARAAAEVAPDAFLGTKLWPRARYLRILGEMVEQALADESREELERLWRDIESYLERRRGEGGRPLAEPDAMLDETLALIGGARAFPELASAAQSARRELAELAAENAGS